MDIRGLEPHQPQERRRQGEPFVVPMRWHLDLRNVGRELADEPAVVDLVVRIGNPNSVL
jgi:hypothetical protein